METVTKIIPTQTLFLPAQLSKSSLTFCLLTLNEHYVIQMTKNQKNYMALHSNSLVSGLSGPVN